ncbi:MAG TPA: hypothetical protein VFA48_07420 [Gammaproteobacteria bacterium]|nr:hypothetical protein [Gammaproteobacteria bacterium]
MKLTHEFRLLTGVTSLTAAGLLVAGCAMGGQPAMQRTATHEPPMKTHSMATNRFGGPVYDGKPALAVTVALVEAGGGPGHFSLVTALDHMLGKKTVHAEVAKLTRQYGSRRVSKWVAVMNFYVDDTLKIVKAKDITLPAPAKLSGVQLAKTLVKAGTDAKDTFWAGYLFDHAVSHPIHKQLMNDADAKFGAKWDANAHAITNQAFYDVAHALGDKSVKLAPYHS